MTRVLKVLGGLNRGGAETMVMNLYRNVDRNHIQFDFIIHTTEKQDYYDEIQVRCRLTKQKFFYKRTKGHCRKIVVVVIDIISCKPKKIWYADFY